MNNASQTYADLISRLERLRRTRAQAEVLFGAAATLTGVAGLAVLALLLEAGLYLPPAAKLTLWGIGSCGVVVGLAALCVRPLIRRRGLDRAALDVEARHPDLRQRLVGIVQLWPGRASSREGYSAELIEAMVEQAGAVAGRLDFEAAVDRGPYRRAVRWLTAACAALGVLFASDGVRAAAGRLWRASAHFPRPSATQVWVSPGDATVLKGEDFAVAARFSGRIPASGEVAFREEGSEVWERAPFAVADGGATHRFREVKRSFTYRVRAGDGESPAFRLRALDRPTVLRLRMTYRYPAYTGLGERTEEDGGDISAVKGTRVRMEVLANKPLRSAEVAFEDGEKVEAPISSAGGRSGTADLVVTQDRRYTIRLVDAEGVPSTDAMAYRMVAIPDESPTVRVAFPGRDVEVGEEMVVPLQIEAKDDFGLSRMELLYALNDEAEERRVALGVGAGGDVSVRHLWDLSGMNLLPDDRVRYRVRVYDNDRVGGPKAGETPTFTIKLPSLAEIAQEAERTQQEGVASLQEVSEEGRRIQARLEEIRRELLKRGGEKGGDLAWEKRKDIEAALARQEQAFDALARRAEELVRAQERVNEGLEAGQPAPDLANREQGVKQETERVRDAMREVAQGVREEHAGAADSLEALARGIGEERLPERMEAVSEEIQAGERERTRAEGGRLSKSLSRLSKSLRQSQRSFAQQSKAAVAAEMERALHEAVALSRREEEVARETAGMDRGAPGHERAAGAQQDLLSGAARLTDRVMQTGEKTFFIRHELRRALGASLRRMKEAVSLLEDRNGAGASERAREAMGALNEAAILLRQAMSDLDASASATGMDEMIERMRALTDRQSRVNQGTQEMLGPGEQGTSFDPNGGLSQLAAEQEAIRQAFRQMEGGMEGQGGALGRLDRIGEEMDRVLEDLRGRVSRKTVERQREILSRMLDATRSIRQRGFSEERQSEVGKDYRYAGPWALPEDLGQGTDPLREAMLRALKEGYPGEYRALIRGYFEALVKERAEKEEGK